MLVLVGGVRLLYGFRAGYTGCVVGRFLLVYYGRGWISYFAVRDYCRDVRLFVYRRFDGEEFSYTVFDSYGMYGTFYAVAFNGLGRFIGFLA